MSKHLTIQVQHYITPAKPEVCGIATRILKNLQTAFHKRRKITISTDYLRSPMSPYNRVDGEDPALISALQSVVYDLEIASYTVPNSALTAAEISTIIRQVYATAVEKEAGDEPIAITVTASGENYHVHPSINLNSSQRDKADNALRVVKENLPLIAKSKYREEYLEDIEYLFADAHEELLESLNQFVGDAS